jgi:hypothetical protein
VLGAESPELLVAIAPKAKFKSDLTLGNVALFIM